LLIILLLRGFNYFSLKILNIGNLTLRNPNFQYEIESNHIKIKYNNTNFNIYILP